ncbi:MAG: tRNA pseudouridine(38-40) synthase TruA [Methanoregulaceae archaeon]|jgi:tRNA pseudouridine38-40 synthase|nr:tRNA pseudouridine(38-40) synthase TruA [Methanoregulaceae archaeon]
MEETETPGIPKVKLAFRVAYRGDNFNGSQMQPGLRTVEGEFIAACQRVGLFEDWRDACFAASGRTDRGVHATGQVFSFLTGTPSRAVAALNFQLPPDCWCTGYTLVPPGFHPRYDAKYRTYRYFFREQDLDTKRMEAAATLFLGVHDFSGFARVDKKNPERKVLAASIGRDEGVMFLEITAESFLWHMVRCIASAVRDIGMGTTDEAGIRRRLEGDYSGGIHPAPPDGLVLWDVVYNLPFTPLPQEARRLEKIREWQGYHRVMTGICRIFSEPETHRREMP